MKRLIGLVVGAMMVLVAVACGDASLQTVEASVTESTAPPSTTTTTEAFDPFGMHWGETVVFTDVDDNVLLVTVEAPVDDTQNVSKYQTDYLDGGHVWYCLVTFENQGAISVYCNPFQFTAYDSSNMAGDDLVLVDISEADLEESDILPGRTVTGAVAYIIPEGRALQYLDFQPSAFGEVVASWGE